MTAPRTSEEDRALEEAARAFAEERHATQKYGDRPYLVHLSAVRDVLRSMGHGGPLAVAAWLHDVVEDTPTTKDEVCARFGADVAALVWAVTGVGANRSERNASAYAKIRATPDAATLKLADRIANVEASRGRPDKLAMYRGEWASFEAALRGFGDERMWERLRRALSP
jgi:(p)ppGpp synthase/HD superfamily hydrolase